MKRLLSFLSLLIVAVSSFAQQFTVGYLTYSILSTTNKTAQVYSGTNVTGAVVIPETVTYNDEEYRVTTVKSVAFKGNTNITSVEMPYVTTVYDGAFQNCTSLVSAFLPSVTYCSYDAFRTCSSLRTVDVSSVPSIGMYTFQGCSSLESIDLSSVKSVSMYAFQGCKKINSLRVGSLEQWLGVGFYNSDSHPLFNASQSVDLYVGDSPTPATVIEVPNTITNISSIAFRHTTITSVSAPSVVSVGASSFSNCSRLTSVELPLATTIGASAFYNCPITSVELPLATAIGASAFYNCPITSVELPLATAIDASAFENCTHLASIELPLAASIQEKTFNNCSALTSVSCPSATTIGSSAFTNCRSLASVSIPCATSIGEKAFYGCSSLSSIDVSAVTNIDRYAFYECSSLTSVDFPLVISVGDYAFQNCTGLTLLEFPSSTTRIGGFSFEYCSNLTSVTILSNEASIGGFAFAYCSSLSTLKIPFGVASIGGWSFGGGPSLDYIYINDVESWCNISGIENITSYGTSSKKLFINDEAVENVVIPDVVESLPKSVFYGFKQIKSVYIPSSVKSIGQSAFKSCSSLTSIALSAATSIDDAAFEGCSKIRSLRIGSVEQWCNVNFKGTSSNPLGVTSQTVELYFGNSDTPATEITIPASVQQIPQYAFAKTDIHTIHFEGTTPPTLVTTNSFPTSTMLAVPEEAYETYLAAEVYKTIPLRITKEGHVTKEVEMEADATTSKLLAKIGEDEVRYVVNLKITGTINSYDMLIIRNQMPSLRNLDLTNASIVDCNYIYSNAGGVNYHSQKDVVTGDWLTKIMNVKLPATTKTIGNRAFYNNTNLVNVTVPEGVTSIGTEAFYGCKYIKELVLPQSVTSFGSDAFNKCTGLKEVNIPDGVVSITSYAFQNCTDLEKVTIPASVKKIGEFAFRGGLPKELHIGSLETWLDMEIVQNGTIQYIEIVGANRGPFSDVAKLYIGNNPEPTEHLIIPNGVVSIKSYTFGGFSCLKSISLPEGLESIKTGSFQNCNGLSSIIYPGSLTRIYNQAFSGCTNLENVEFTDGIQSIGSYAFSGCSKLTKIELPAYLKSIGSYAFQNCSNLAEVLIPASITEIQDYAFQGCSNLNRVIATTVEPVKINQNTFSTYKTATLFTPTTSYYKYYWNTQYNQFLAKAEYDKEFSKSFGYKYFYLNGVNGDNPQDFEITDETGPLHGVGDDNPDADFNEGAGMIVSGEQIQNLGDIHIHHNGNNGASVIAKQSGKVHIDNLYVDIKTQKNRWYFFCFPFDIKPGEATYDGSHVWYLYDGEARALNGNGGWKKVAADGVMKSGNGYIFQGAVNGTLTIHVQDITIDTDDASTNMITYQSDNKNDASWNLIGNANFAYYDIDNLGYDAPITVYNNETGNYEAVRAEDEDYEFYPFQAFFVQKPEGTESMDFDATKKETKNKSDENKAKKAAARAGAPKKVDPSRQLINLEFSAVDLTEDAETATAADRTRIVVNAAKSLAYEPECDAAKFIADGMPQIYSLDAENTMYAINERPAADGIVPLAVKVTEDGFYTISASRLDCAAQLRDLETGDVIDLAEGDYTFAAKAKTYTQRFQLLLADAVEGIEAIEVADAISVEAGAIAVNDQNADVKIYTAGGVLVAAQKGLGSVKVPAGVYVINVNGQSTKVTVKE